MLLKLNTVIILWRAENSRHLYMLAKLDNFKNEGFGEATTISWILEIVIFNIHCASTCVRVNLSFYKYPE